MDSSKLYTSALATVFMALTVPSISYIAFNRHVFGVIVCHFNLEVEYRRSQILTAPM